MSSKYRKYVQTSFKNICAKQNFLFKFSFTERRKYFLQVMMISSPRLRMTFVGHSIDGKVFQTKTVQTEAEKKFEQFKNCR